LKKHLILLIVLALVVSPAFAADDVILLHGNSLPVVDAAGNSWSNVGVTSSAGYFSNALSFNGSSYLSTSDKPDFNYGDGRPAAWDFWVKLTSAPPVNDKYVIFSQGSLAGQWMVIELFNDAVSGKIGLVIERNNNPFYAYTNVVPGVWTHLAIQKEGNSYRMYQDCVSYPVTGSNPNLNDFSGSVYIGQHVNGGHKLRGQIDEFYFTRTVRFTDANCVLPTSEYGSPSATATPSLTATVTATRTPTQTPTVTNTPLPTATPTPFIWSCVPPLVAVAEQLDPQNISLTCR
jgi:hypothetical protein